MGVMDEVEELKRLRSDCDDPYLYLRDVVGITPLSFVESQVNGKWITEDYLDALRHSLRL